MTFRVAGTWLGVMVASGTLVAGVVASLTYIFATKQELTDLERVQMIDKADVKLRDFRIRRLEVQVQNVENIAQRTDRNVEQLLIERQMIPLPRPNVKPLPIMPSADSLLRSEQNHGRP